MGKKNIESSVFETKEFRIVWDSFQLSSVYGTLEGDNNINTVFGGQAKEDHKEIIDFCNKFEEKYNKKLNYKIEDGMYYLFY
jgi:hypothetical protein